jgi:hypothetical protein
MLVILLNMRILGFQRASLGEMERERSLDFVGTRTPDRPGRNAETGHAEHNMMAGRNSAGRNSELHELYSTHDEHYL